jgi:uncharacterized protein (TIGR02145 family)
MAENLNCEAAGGVCYDNDYANCKKYGRLYNWNEAMKACPAGWHLPSDAEWDTLVNYVGGSLTAGKKLKATSGWGRGESDWEGSCGSCNGTDEFGFSALPGGGTNFSAGGAGLWWSKSAIATEFDIIRPWFRYMDNGDGAGRMSGIETNLYSVRCVQD